VLYHYSGNTALYLECVLLAGKLHQEETWHTYGDGFL